MRAQSPDSLIILLKTHPDPDTVRADLLFQITRILVNGSNYSLRIYANELLQTAEKINSPLYLVRGYMTLGVSYAREGTDLSSALAAYQEAYNIASKLPGEAWRRREAQVFINMAFVHNLQNNFDQSIAYQTKANQILVRIGDTAVLADNIRGIALIYQQKGSIDSALIFMKKALNLYEKYGNKEGVLASYGILGGLYQHQGNYAIAKIYLEKCMQGQDSVNNPTQYAGALQDLGELYKNNKEWAKAKYYLSRALPMVQKQGTADVSLLHLGLAEVYAYTGQPDSAAFHLGQYKNTFEANFRLEKSKQFEELESKFQLSEKEKENELLRREKELTRLSTTIYQIALMGLMAILLIGGYLLWRLNIKNKIIARQSAELDQLNQNLQQKNAMLENMMRDKRFLVSLLAHDLRSPLATLQFGIVELQTFPAVIQAEVKPLMQSMERSLGQIDEMIHRIIEVEQIENTVRNGHMVKVDLNQLMAGLQEEYQDISNKKHQNLKWNPLPEQCLVEGDSYLLRRIIGNLISNAIKFSPEGKTISMLLEKGEQHAQIQIVDEGPGIDVGEEKFIFQKYYRNVRTGMGKDASLSLGLGLFLVRQYVELHKGTVSVHTRPGEGTIFRIQLPLIYDRAS